MTRGRRAALIGWAIGLLVACGHSSEPTGPDVVPTDERATVLQQMKDRLTPSAHVQPMTITDIIALPTYPRAYTRSQLAEIESLEDRGVVVTGYLARLRNMDDGDFHVQITEAPPGRCLYQDTRDQLITELTPGIQARRPAYTFDALAALCGAGTALRVTGWLLYDSPHKGDSGRSTPWEVHPITRIEVCCWRELG